MASVSGRPDLAVEPVAPMGTGSPTMTSPTGSLISTPFVNPEPAYIAAKEAAFIITREVLVEFHQLDEADFTQMQETSLSQISPSAIANVNAFLDRILLNILSNARSLSLVSLRPAVRDVLRPKLAQEAIDGADEELHECIGDDDEAAEFQDAQETQDGPWDLDLAWKRARLRCMVYTRLGDMEEEDEDRYIDENGLENYSARRMSGGGGMVSPPVAIWLTAILEFIGENVLIVAGHAAYRRCENKYGRGIAGQALHPSVVLVGDHDLEKIALSPVLGRLWRAWRKPIRSPKTSISRALSIDSMRRHRRVDSRSSTGLTRKTSSETLSSLRPEPGSQRASLVKEAPAPIDPAMIALPISEHDVHEIEIPWFNAAARNASRPLSILAPKDEEAMLAAIAEASPVEDDKKEKAEKTLRRMRSGSFPSTKWDFAILHPKDISMPEKKEEKEQETENQKEEGQEKKVDGEDKEAGAEATTEVEGGKPKATAAPMSGTISGPDEFQAPVEVPKAEKRLSTISQRRRNRLSYRPEDRKSQVSDSESGGPALFSRKDYKVEQHEIEPLPTKNLDVPPPATNVISATPIVSEAPKLAGVEDLKENLSPPKKKYAHPSRDSPAYASGEVSPLEPSDDEGSGSITGLKDAQEHFSVAMQKSASTQRTASRDRSVSPIVEPQYYEAPVSPMSPDEDGKEKRWHGMESPSISPVERRSMLPPPAGTAPQAATIPAVAPPPVYPIAEIAPAAAAPAVQPTQVSAAPTPLQPTRTSPRSTQAMGLQGNDDRRRDGMVAPDLVSTDHTQNGLPDRSKDMQANGLVAAAAAAAAAGVVATNSAHRSVNQQQQQSLPTQRSSGGSDGRASHERAGRAVEAPVVPAKDTTPAVQPRQPARDRAVAPPSEPLITSVTPVPAPVVSGQPSNAPQFRKPVSGQPSNAPNFNKAAAVPSQQSNDLQFSKAPAGPVQPISAPQAPIHRKDVSQDSRPGTGHGITPLNLGTSLDGTAPPASKLLERRMQLPQVETVPSERAADQRWSPSPTTANDVSRQVMSPPKSVPDTVQSASPSSATRRKPTSRSQSQSGEEILSRLNHGPSADKAKEFNRLIDSDETLQLTITPQHLWEQPQVSTDSLGVPQNRTGSYTTQKWQDTSAKPVPADRNVGQQSSNNQPANKPRSGSKTFVGFPVRIPFGAYRSSSRQSMTKSGMAPREAKTVSESMREFADFMRNTGPDPPQNQAQGAGVRPSASMGNLGPNKRVPQPISKKDIAVRPAVVSMPGGTKSKPNRLVARDPQASSGGISDLISFMQEESPRNPVNTGTNGVGRMAGGGGSYGGSVNSTQESFKAGSINSHTGLLAGRQGGGGGYMGGVPEEPMMPVRKSRKPRDPYAIDDDDDLLEEDEMGGGNEESLADFLGGSRMSSNGMNGGGLSSHPPRTSSAVPHVNQNQPQAPMRVGASRGANAGKVSSIGRPIGPEGIPSRQSLLQPRGGGGSSTLDLADFLNHSGPPPGTISRIPEEEKKPSGRVFGRRQKAM